MIDLTPAPVPQLDADWVTSHRDSLVAALSERRRHPLRWAGMAATTGVAATVASLLLVGGGETYAFAGWSPVPTAPAGSQLSSAQTTCLARLAQAAQLPPSNKGPAPGAAPYTPELNDVRGPYTLTVLGDGGPGAALCISAPNATSLRWVTASGPAPDPGAITVDQVSLLARDGQPYTLVQGRVGTGVTGVNLTLGDATQVLATSGDGLFTAWWPGTQSLSSAAITSAAGTSTQALNLSGPPDPAQPKTPPSGRPEQSSCVPSASVACAGS
jgi:hypothetical protein